MGALVVNRSLGKCFSIGPGRSRVAVARVVIATLFDPCLQIGRHVKLHPEVNAILDFHVDEPELFLDQGFHVKRVQIAE